MTDIFDKLCEKHALTDEACAWLKAYLDPFHDYELTVSGMPDSTTGKSVVVCARKKLVISPPAFLGPNEKWDCHIALTPTLAVDDSGASAPNTGVWKCGRAYEGLASAGSTGTFVPGATTSTFGFNNIVVWKDYSGRQTFAVTSDGQTSASVTSVDITEFVNNSVNSGLNDHCKAGFRMIAGGFEVENTTPELTRSGDVTVYRMHQVNDTQHLRCAAQNPPVSIAFSGNAEVRLMPPPNISAAVALLGSRSWAAAEGAYVAFRLTDIEKNDVVSYGSKAMLLSASDGVEGSFIQPNFVSSFMCDAGQNTVGEAWSTADSVPVALHQFDTSGAYFTGLSAETTLSLYTRQYIELFPTNNDMLVSMAKPSPQASSLALEIAQRTALSLPAGCPRKDNDAGAFFRSVLKVASRVLPVLAPIAGAYAPVVGAAGALAMAESRRLEEKSKNKMKTKAPDVRARPKGPSPSTKKKK